MRAWFFALIFERRRALETFAFAIAGKATAEPGYRQQSWNSVTTVSRLRDRARISEIEWSEAAVAHIARHGIAPEDVEEVVAIPLRRSFAGRARSGAMRDGEGHGHASGVFMIVGGGS